MTKRIGATVIALVAGLAVPAHAALGPGTCSGVAQNAQAQPLSGAAVPSLNVGTGRVVATTRSGAGVGFADAAAEVFPRPGGGGASCTGTATC